MVKTVFLKQLKKALFILITQLLQQQLLEKLMSLQKKGFGFLDAPVSGGQAGAENGASNCNDWWRSSMTLIKLKTLLIVIAKR